MTVTTSLLLAKCSTCRYEHAYPTLSDFDYGSFVLTRRDGQSYLHLSAIGSNAWSEIRCVAEEDGAVSPDVLQEIVASLADTDHELTFTMKRICPRCLSTSFDFWGGGYLGTAQLKEATFDYLIALDSERRRILIKSTRDKLISEQIVGPNRSLPPSQIATSSVRGPED